MAVVRLVATVVAFTVMGLGYVGGTAWFFAIPAGIIGYLIVLYVGSASLERQRLRREREQYVEKAIRGAPPDKSK